MELDLPGADVRLLKGWLRPSDADALLGLLLEQVDWEVHRIRMFGREVDSPRLSRWIGEPGASYRYSGTLFAPHPWPSWLVSLRGQLQQVCGAAFNSVLLNRYRSGSDSMGWHSDDEPELGPAPLIASLSVGATRRFSFRHRHQHDLRTTLDLGHGDLLLMAGQTQRLYQHALPRTVRALGERVNLTFRNVHA